MNTKEKEIYNVDKAWGKLHSRFEEDGLLTADKKIRSIDFYMIAKIAAVFIVGIFVSYMAYNSLSNNGLKYAETFTTNKIRVVELPDGSVVHLNKKSKLYYPENFADNNRTVELEGEAFFDITKNHEKPFIIKARNKEIKVLGTSFNVNTNFNNKKVEVYVETGKVKFYEPGNAKNELILEPGSVGIIENKADQRSNDDPNYMSWKTKLFDFSEGEKLDKVIATINKAYGVKIVLDDAKYAERDLYNTFDNDPLDTILKVLCAPYDLVSDDQGEIIILKSK